MEINREYIDSLAEAIRIADLTGCGLTKIPTPNAKEIFEILSECIRDMPDDRTVKKDTWQYVRTEETYIGMNEDGEPKKYDVYCCPKCGWLISGVHRVRMNYCPRCGNKNDSGCEERD